MIKTNVGFKWIGLFLLVGLCSSCAKSLVYWDQARASFSQGAEMELKNRFADRLGVQGEIPAEALPNINALIDAPPATEVETDGNPDEKYRMADQQISDALEVPGPLIKQNKMGNALTLKALTCWKTGQANEARASADDALEAMNDPGDDSFRDRSLAKSIPGLVALDLAYDSTHAFVKRLKELSAGAATASRSTNEAIVAEGTRRYRKFIFGKNNPNSIAGANTMLQEAADLADQQEDVRRFLLLCELTGLKNRFDFWAQLNNYAALSGIKAEDQELKDWLSEEESDYYDDKDAALEKLKAMLEQGDRSSVYEFWDGIL